LPILLAEMVVPYAQVMLRICWQHGGEQQGRPSSAVPLQELFGANRQATSLVPG
jgi:hypothetical protein